MAVPITYHARKDARARFALWLLLLLAVAAGAWYWSNSLSPTAQARQAAHDFWVAVTAGDEAAVAAMMADDADFTAAEVIQANRGLIAPPRPSGLVHPALTPNQTGTEFVVTKDLIGPPDPVPSHLRVLGLKRVNLISARAGRTRPAPDPKP